MNRTDAKKIAETINIKDLKFMVVNAYSSIKDWKQPSKVNKSMSVGTTFNVLTSCEFKDNMSLITKINLLREFGEFLPEDLKPVKVHKSINLTVTHQEPNILNKTFYEF